MESDVILNKITVIERCYARIKDVYANDPNNLTDFTKQDSIVLNIQRACEACIDLAMHVSAEKSSGYLKRVGKPSNYFMQIMSFLKKPLPI